MKQFLKLIAFTILVIGCSKKQNSFSISGTIPLEKNTTAILSMVENIQENSSTVIDTLHLNERGEFASVYFLPQGIYTLKISKKTFQLAIDYNQHLTLKGKDVEHVKIKGSKDTKLLVSYEKFRKESLNRLVKSIRNKIKNIPKTPENEPKIIELRALEVENYKKHIQELTEFIKEKMGTSIAIYPTSIRWSGEENLPFYKELVSNFEELNPHSQITTLLKNKLELLQKTTVGSLISSFELPNAEDKKIALDSIKGKITLVDFWASWCPPCRTESKLLNELYSSYNSKGFEIYGISLDNSKKRWLNALEIDNRIWTNVSTLEGFKTGIAKEYGITALPTNFLIDEHGKIIAVNMHSNQLKLKIEELFN